MAASSRFAAHCMRLGLSKPPATRAELTAAYRRAALKHHPDRGGSAPAFAAVTDSYNALLHVCAPAAAAAYTPASLRSHGAAAAAAAAGGGTSGRDGTRQWAPLRGITTVVVLPCAIGMAVGLRLLYARPDTDELRAGGTSRFVPDRLTDEPHPRPRPQPRSRPRSRHGSTRQ